jgi:hypothetical protein
MVALESIAMTRPDWAVMQVAWNSVDGSEVQARSHHTERRALWEGQTDIDNLARGTSGVRLRLWMKEGSRRCDVDSSTWTDGIPDHMGDLGGMKVADDGATTHYQFHWSGEDYSVLMSVEERARKALAEE